jgi:hypothetical protein
VCIKEKEVMKRMNIMGTLLAAVFVVGLVGAASASALSTNNPQWQILSTILKAGETKNIRAEARGTQTLAGTGLTIECKEFSLAAGAHLIGSNAPNPGTSEETIVYSNCTIPASAKCKINGAVPGKIETKPLLNLLVFLTEVGALNENALESGTLFEPKTAPTFALFVLTEEKPGTKECPLTGDVLVEGSGVIVKNLTADVLSLAHEIDAPTTAIKTYWVNEGGVSKQKTGVNIKVAGLAATYSGNSKVFLENDDLWDIFN